jgi:PAS domain S-box-containing protein
MGSPYSTRSLVLLSAAIASVAFLPALLGAPRLVLVTFPLVTALVTALVHWDRKQALRVGQRDTEEQKALIANLTEREVASELVRRSEARLKLVVDQALDAVITMNGEGLITGWNSQADAIFGWPAEQVLGRRLSETIIPLHYREPHEAAFRRILDGAPPRLEGRRIEITALRRGGEEFPVELTVGAARLGEEMFFSAFVRDITERKAAEQALRESEDRYRAFVTQSSEAIWCFELEHPMPRGLDEPEQIAFFYKHGYLSHCNNAMALMYGLSEAKDLLGLRLGETLVETDPANVEYLRRFIRSGYHLTDAESHEIDAEGRHKYFLNNLIGIFQDGVLYRVWGTQRDITERRLVEERTQVLGTLSHQLSGAKTPEEAGRIIVDSAQHLLQWDAAALDLYSAEHDRLTAVLTMDTADGVIKDFPAISRITVPSPMVRKVMSDGPQLVLRGADELGPSSEQLVPFGETGRRSASLMFVPIRNQDKVIGVLTIQSYKRSAYTASDLAVFQVLADTCGAALARISAEQELQNTAGQLQHSQRMEAVGRLAGGVAHDFNNLLTTILGTSDLLLEQLPPPWREDVLEIKRAGERAAELTKQLLAFSRKQVIEARALNLNQVLEGVVGMLKRLIGADVELILRTDPTLGTIRADAGQLEQVMVNLVVNARDAMPEGGKLYIETGNVDLEAEHESWSLPAGRYVMLTVTDTGVGMSPETQEHIFEPFFTTKEKGKGTGLGLAMVYGIIRQSGGRISAYSEPGAGAVFRIYLPRVDDTAQSRHFPVPAPALSGSETILIAEDEMSVRGLARRILESSGYLVLAAANGEEALRVASSHEGPIHLLLTDVVMPGMSGPELAERLAQHRNESRVLFMSGYTDSAMLHHGLLKGGLSYLAKPFSPSALKRRVRETLDQSPAG